MMMKTNNNIICIIISKSGSEAKQRHHLNNKFDNLKKLQVEILASVGDC